MTTDARGLRFWLTEVQLCAMFPFLFSTERQIELLQTAENAQLVRDTVNATMQKA